MRILEAAGSNVDISISRRVTEKGGIDRGDELAAVLRLKKQFPSSANQRPRFWCC